MKPRPLHREDIKSRIRKEYGSLAAFERQKALPEGSARDVLRGKSVSRTAEAIAQELGVSFKAISPNQKHVKTRVATDNMSTIRDLHPLNEGAK